MGCGASTATGSSSMGYEIEENNPFLATKKANDLIEQQLQMNYKREKNQTKLLLLGTGESGKSTVLKQLQLLHHGGFSHQERIQYAQVIWADAIQSMKILIVQARRLDVPLLCDDPMNYADLFECKKAVLNSQTLDFIDTSKAGGSNFLNDYVLKYSERSEKRRRNESSGKVDSLNFDNMNGKEGKNKSQDLDENSATKLENLLQNVEDLENNNLSFLNKKAHDSPTLDIQNKRIQLATAIRNLWEHDIGIQQCFDRANEFQLEGSAEYYFENIFKFSQMDYVCTDEDILRGRIKTSGITETIFQIKSREFKVLDAGGQRSERRKWIHCFEGITCILFVVAVSEYDQMLFEDEQVNRMHESLMLFQTLCNSQWFKNTPFIIFFNKIDLFQAKIKKSPLRKYFPDYQGPSTDFDASLKYFEKLFLSLNMTNKPIYIHRTCATDTKSMKFILDAVTDMIIQQNLKKSGLM
ncbi:guanine nucleotide-binding protein subunit alpha [Hanseniaspora osmophila]